MISNFILLSTIQGLTPLFKAQFLLLCVLCAAVVNINTNLTANPSYVNLQDHFKNKELIV
jgi:hypothetical protein